MSRLPETAPTAEPPVYPASAELERGLNLVGLGWYNLRYCMTLLLLLVSSVMETVGTTILLPAAKCDLNISDKQRGLVFSIPYIGIFLTSYIYGYLVDTKGRRKMIIYTSLLTGCINFLSAFMPNLLTFSICKFLTSLCISVPFAIPYTFIGEIVPARYRDILLSLVNALQTAGAILASLIAWVIIPLDFRIDVGIYTFRPWRLLAVIYSSFFILTSCLLTFGPESPKFLLSQGKPEAALKVLQIMYAANKRKQPEDFPIKSLPTPPKLEYNSVFASIKGHTMTLMKWQYFKYLLLNGSLLFGIFFMLNGINMWVFEVLNRILSNDSNDKTACEVIMAHPEHNDEGLCDDSIDIAAFKINAMAQLFCTMIGLGVSLAVSLIGKKLLLLTCFYLTGAFCMVINHITCDVLTAVLISLLPLLAFAIGPVNAYALQIFPTHIRGMAVCVCMMVGRLGSISGSALTGCLINVVCTALFYGNSVLLIACGSLTFLYKK